MVSYELAQEIQQVLPLIVAATGGAVAFGAFRGAQRSLRADVAAIQTHLNSIEARMEARVATTERRLSDHEVLMARIGEQWLHLREQIERVDKTTESIDAKVDRLIERKP